jgi:methyltransferase-like protein
MKSLASVVAGHDKPYARCLREEAEKIVGHDESYLAHDYLEESNHPVYLHEFVDRAAAHGLHYLTEAEYWTTAAAAPAELFKGFENATNDWLGREQLYDFIKGRAFRHAVLCRQGTARSPTPSAQAIKSLRISSLVRPATECGAPHPDGGEEFQNFRGEHALTTNDPVVKNALRILNAARPHSLPYGSLWAQTEERLTSSSIAVGPDTHSSASPGQLAETLLGLFTHNIVELHIHEPAFTSDISAFPCASPVARRQAVTKPRVANLRHRMVALSDFDQLVLPHLDGKHDRRAILSELHSATQTGDFTVRSQGQPVTDAEEIKTALAPLLEDCLARMAVALLLVG